MGFTVETVASARNPRSAPQERDDSPKESTPNVDQSPTFGVQLTLGPFVLAFEPTGLWGVISPDPASEIPSALFAHAGGSLPHPRPRFVVRR